MTSEATGRMTSEAAGRMASETGVAAVLVAAVIPPAVVSAAHGGTGGPGVVPMKVRAPEQVPPVVGADAVTHGAAVAPISEAVRPTDNQVDDENDYQKEDDGAHSVSGGIDRLIILIRHISSVVIIVPSALLGGRIQDFFGNTVKGRVNADQFRDHIVDRSFIVAGIKGTPEYRVEHLIDLR